MGGRGREGRTEVKASKGIDGEGLGRRELAEGGSGSQGGAKETVSQ